MADEQKINLTANFKATADVGEIDRAIAKLESLRSKISSLERAQTALNRLAVKAGTAFDVAKEAEAVAAKAGRDPKAEVSAAVGKLFKSITDDLSKSNIPQAKLLGLGDNALASVQKTVDGLGGLQKTLSGAATKLLQEGIVPAREKLERDLSAYNRATGAKTGKGWAKGVLGADLPKGVDPDKLIAGVKEFPLTKDTPTAELAESSRRTRSKAAAKNKEVKAAAEKVEQAVVQTIQTAAESLKQTASSASQTTQARARIRQATGTSRVIGETLLLGAGQAGGTGAGSGAGTGAGAGPRAGAGGTRARKPFGYDEATNKATDSLNREARAAKETAVAMKGLAEAKKQVVTGEKAVASSTGRVIDQLMKEMKAAPKAAAALHQMLRQMEAANNPRYARGFSANNQAIGNISRSADSARRSFVGMAGAQDSFLGQVKQVAVMATSFSILQGVAGRLQEGFSHLTGGIIGFNQMLERTEVGFRRLFTNQAQQVEVARGFGDTTQQVEYLKMGYEDADAAAAGVVDTIRQFANVTPFRFEELAQATLRMRAFGFSLDEVLYKSESTESGFDGAVVAIGDAVSALGGGALEFQRITYALGQMKQAGRVYQNDMMQLANAGIGGYRYIADQLKREITVGGTGQREDVKDQHRELYDQLSKNTIETVRRLTTNGQISGEAAARAIIKGLKTDFGGGMKDFSKTFVGAWSTLADTSQSLVATAFEPFYKRLVTQLYELGQFFQGPKAAEIAKSFQPIIKGITDDLFKFIGRIGEIIGKVIADVGGAFGGVRTQFSNLGINGGDVLNTLRDGIIVITDLLRNDMTRSIITTSVAFSSLMSFAKANPMLTAIMAIVFALGALRQAYISNFLGFATAVNELSYAIAPLINSIKQDLIPALADVGAFVAQYIIAGLIVAFKAAAPFITAVVAAVAGLLKVIKPLAPLIAGIVVALVTKFAYSRIVLGFQSVAFAIARAAVQMRRFGREAALASEQAKAASTSALVATTGGVVGSYGPSRAQLGAGTTQVGGFRGVIGGIGRNALSIGMAGTIGASLAEMAGVPTQITSVVNAVSSALMGFGILKQLFPGSVLGAIKTGLAGIGTSLGTLLTKFGGGTLLANLSGLGPAIGALASSFSLGPTALLIAFAAAIGVAAAAVANGLNKINQDIPEVAAAKIYHGGILEMRDALGLNNVKPQPGMPKKTPTQIVQDRANYEKQKAPIDAERLERARMYAYYRDGSALAAQKEKEAQDKIAEDMKLLVEKEQKSLAAANARAKAQEKYNRLLQNANYRLEYGNSLLRELAEGALDNLLNPDINRINPYTGLAQEALKVEEILKISSDMQFTQFENAQGTTRTFDEYKDILTSIKPLTEKDYYQGKLSLQAVTSRLKIEKERRQELELTKKIQEAEYDLSLQVLRQYDESIDPLERAISMRKAQVKYEEDIRDVRTSGLELAVNEADASQQMVVAEARIAKKLKDIQRGQELILQEMARRFDDYNQEVARIMANPDFSVAKRKELLRAALDGLTQDLEDNFGITEAQLQSQYDRMNAQMDEARNATAQNYGEFMKGLANPTIPPITWGGRLRDALKSGVFDPLIRYLTDQYNTIAALINKINALAGSGSGGPGGGPGGGTDNDGDGTTVADVAANRSANLSARLGKAPANFWQRFGGDSTAEKQESMRRWIESIQERIGSIGSAKTVAAARSIANSIASALSAKGLASGGLASGGNPYLVGENGPELFLPSKTGLVLNNSVSSRLIGMLSGGASSQPGSVNITINNPTIRNDADIRKLADQITRAQVSIYRTQGGRLS